MPEKKNKTNKTRALNKKRITHAYFQRGRERTCEDPAAGVCIAHSLSHQHNDEARTRARQPVGRVPHTRNADYVGTFGFSRTLPHDDV